MVCFQQHHILFMSQMTDAGKTYANRQRTTVSFEVTRPRCVVIFQVYFKNQSYATYNTIYNRRCSHSSLFFLSSWSGGCTLN